jgi:hypothetical protein
MNTVARTFLSQMVFITKNPAFATGVIGLHSHLIMGNEDESGLNIIMWLHNQFSTHIVNNITNKSELVILHHGLGGMRPHLDSHDHQNKGLV